MAELEDCYQYCNGSTFPSSGSNRSASKLGWPMARAQWQGAKASKCIRRGRCSIVGIETCAGHWPTLPNLHSIYFQSQLQPWSFSLVLNLVAHPSAFHFTLSIISGVHAISSSIPQLILPLADQNGTLMKTGITRKIWLKLRRWRKKVRKKDADGWWVRLPPLISSNLLASTCHPKRRPNSVWTRTFLVPFSFIICINNIIIEEGDGEEDCIVCSISTVPGIPFYAFIINLSSYSDLGSEWQGTIWWVVGVQTTLPCLPRGSSMRLCKEISTGCPRVWCPKLWMSTILGLLVWEWSARSSYSERKRQMKLRFSTGILSLMLLLFLLLLILAMFPLPESYW